MDIPSLESSSIETRKKINDLQEGFKRSITRRDFILGSAAAVLAISELANWADQAPLSKEIEKIPNIAKNINDPDEYLVPLGIIKNYFNNVSASKENIQNPINYIQDQIQKGVTTKGPSQNSVFNALENKENLIPADITKSNFLRGDKTWQPITKDFLGLSNVDNTTDLLKPISTNTQQALNTKASLLDLDKKVNITDPRLNDSREPLAHNHPLSQIQNSGASVGQVPIWNGSTWSATTVTGTGDMNKSIYDPDGDGKVISSQTSDLSLDSNKLGGLISTSYATLLNLTNGLAIKANLAHTHSQSDVTNLVIDLANKEPSFVSLPVTKGGTGITTIGTTGQVLTVNATGNLGYATPLTAPVASVNTQIGAVVITKTDIGLGNVDNTSDSIKNVLSSTKLITPRTINGVNFDGTANISITDTTKEPIILTGTSSQYIKGDKTLGTLDIAAIAGLTTALTGKAPASPNGYAPLNASSVIDSTYLPSYVDDVQEFPNLSALPATGVSGIIYITINTNRQYRWTGSVYVDITGFVDSVFGRTGAVTSTNGDYTAAQITNTPSGNIFSITVQSALNELDIEKAQLIHTHGSGDITNFVTAAKDAAGAALLSSSSVNLTYNITTKEIGATVNEAGLTSVVKTSQAGVANGYVPLDATQLINPLYLPPIVSSAVQTANNGLTKTMTSVGLGGILAQTTTIDLANFILKFNKTALQTGGIEIDSGNPGTSSLKLTQLDSLSTPTVANGILGVDAGGVIIKASPASALTIVLPVQTTNGGKYLTTDGTNASWSSVTPPVIPYINTITGTAVINTQEALDKITVTLNNITSALPDTPRTLALKKIYRGDKKIKGVMYWPRKSPSQDMWREMRLGFITFADIDADLDQLILADVNTVRVFTFYDHEFIGATTGPGAITPAAARAANIGWTDGLGWYNTLYQGYLTTFIDHCNARGLDVVVTMFQELKALKSTDNWTFLTTEVTNYANFTTWLITSIAVKPNVLMMILKNEPDGYGVWDDYVLAGKVLTFLNTMKAAIKVVTPDMPVVVNCVSYDNNFKKFPSAPTNAVSIYDLTDILAQNTFLWAETGWANAASWDGSTYRRQFDYMRARNYLSKPMLMTECGYPANYAQQEVKGYEILNDDGTPTATFATTTRSSIVPQNTLFDRPRSDNLGAGILAVAPFVIGQPRWAGIMGNLAQNPENQRRAIAEAFYWAERYNFIGGMVWSAYDHAHPTAPFVYRDAFGMFDKNGLALPGVEEFRAAFKGKYTVNGDHHLSLIQGNTSGNGSLVNGLEGWNTVTPANNVVSGVYLSDQQNWISEELIYELPLKLRITVNIKIAYNSTTNPEPLTLIVFTPAAAISFTYKHYGANKFFASSSATQYGSSQSVTLTPGTPMVLEVDLNSLTPTLSFNGTLLAFTPGPFFSFQNWQMDWIKLQMYNKSGVGFEILSAKLIGPAGTPLLRNDRSISFVSTNTSDLQQEVMRLRGAIKNAGLAIN
jgi:hypothetical protein